jgi:hypothetical protein
MGQQTLYNDLEVRGNIFARNIVYTSGDQKVSGVKIFGILISIGIESTTTIALSDK